jgi:hypothetical protein
LQIAFPCHIFSFEGQKYPKYRLRLCTSPASFHPEIEISLYFSLFLQNREIPKRFALAISQVEAAALDPDGDAMLPARRLRSALPEHARELVRHRLEEVA